MKKKILMVLITILCIGLSLNVNAASYDIWIGSTRVTDENASDILGDGTVHFDSATNTLTFDTNNPNIQGTKEGSAIVSYGDLVIDAPNGLEISGTYTNILTSYALNYTSGSLTINGDIKFSSSDEVIRTFVGTVINGNVEISGGMSGFICYEDSYAFESCTINGDVNIEAAMYPIYTFDADMIIDGDAKLKATQTSGSTTAILMRDRGNGTILNVTGNLDIESSGYGIFFDANVYDNTLHYDIDIKGDVNIKSSQTAIIATNIDITGDVNIESESSVYSVFAGNNIIIGGNLETSGSNGNVQSDGTIEMKSGTWIIGGTIKGENGITIPSTHTIVIPEDGSIELINNYYTITESDGSTISNSSKITQIHTVTYELNGGSTDEDTTVDVENGNTLTKPTNPTKDGYTFDNWYSDSAFTTVFDFSESITSDMTLYAKWNEVTSTDDTTNVLGETEVVNNPETLDNITIYLLMLIVSGLMIVKIKKVLN